MPLLPRDRFAPVFAGLAGRRIGLVDGVGNPGDRLIDQATRQLLIHFGLDWRTINPLADPPELVRDTCDVLLLFGGGSMGADHVPSRAIRAAAAGLDLPCIVLPQSFHAPEPGPWQRVFVRERASLRHCPGGTLAPELALGYDFPAAAAPSAGRVVALRRFGRSCFPGYAKVDPVDWCYTAEDYLAWAGRYEHVVTDRLHLAIVALGLGRRATLLPLAWPKNRSLWETWLADLGCEWADQPPPFFQQEAP